MLHKKSYFYIKIQTLCFDDIQKHCKFKAGRDEIYENLDFYDPNDTFDFDDLSELPEDRILHNN